MSMQIFRFLNVSISSEIKCGLFISSISTAPRGSQISTLVQDAYSERWVVVENPNEHLVSSENSSSFKRVSVVCVDSLFNSLHAWLERNTIDIPTVLVDISTMSRPVMAALISAICEIAYQRKLEVIIGYVIASFTTPPDHLPPNEDIRPISESLAGWPSDTSAKTSLIVGLGYEHGKAEGACEYFDASDTWAFVPRSPLVSYDEKVLLNNEQLIRRVAGKNRVVNYRVDNPASAFGELAAVVSALAPKANPIILPFGPKIFFVLAALLSYLYPQMGVWHVSSDNSEVPDDQEGSEHVVGFKVLLGPG